MNRIFILLLFISNIYADVMYEMETTSQQTLGTAERKTQIRNFIKGDFMRTEIKTQDPILGEIENTTIIRLDKGVIWVVDNTRREFSEIPLKIDKIENPAEDTLMQLPEIKIEKLDENKKILKVNCIKYLITMNLETEDGNLEIVQTMWLGRDFGGYDEMMCFNKKMLNTINEPIITGIDNKIIKELKRRLSEIEGFPLEMEANFKMKIEGMDISFQTRSVIKKISTVPISNKVFEIPEGYQLNTSVKTN
ncbi:MAG: DUF4412 domain-containing protein [bacterium]